VESRIPLFDTVIGLDISKDQKCLLVGFGSKPSQLWSVEGNDSGNESTSLSLNLLQSYENTLLISGPSFFGNSSFCTGPTFFFGNSDELVICWNIYGQEFHVWDRQHAVPLHVFGEHLPAGMVLCVGVNRACRSLMFVTSGVNGELTAWRMLEVGDEEELGKKDRKHIVPKPVANETDNKEGGQESQDDANVEGRQVGETGAVDPAVFTTADVRPQGSERIAYA